MEDEDLAFALSMKNVGSGRKTQEEVLDESNMSLAEEIEQLSLVYGERFKKTARGFKLLFESPEKVKVEVEVELDTMMYLEDEPPFFHVRNLGPAELIRDADCRELRSLLEESAEEWMEEEVPILGRLMETVRDWLHWKTEEPAFAPPACNKGNPTKKQTQAKADTKVSAKKIDAEKEKKKQEEKKQAKKDKIAAKKAKKYRTIPKPRPSVPAPAPTSTLPSYWPWGPPQVTYNPTPTVNTYLSSLHRPYSRPAPQPPDMQAIKRRFESLYGRPLSEDVITTWNLPPYDQATQQSVGQVDDTIIARPTEEECDEETLIKVEEAFANESNILNITHKGITQLPIQLLGKLTTLTELNLHNNKLTSLPTSIANLSSLTKLYVSFNRLTEFPAELTNLPNLLNLDLSHNQLITMPAQIDQMSTLQILELNHNQLRGLPPQMGDMAGLKKLYLNNNKLVVVPHELGFLSKLTLLRLNNNPIKNVPVDTYQQGTAAVLEYLRNAGPSIETGGQLKNFTFAKDFSDVDFIVGSHVIPAHKVVLCARSPVMRAFLHSLPESADGQTVELRPPDELSDIKHEVFREFISYLYSDNVNKGKLKEMGEELGRVANYYGVERLEEYCKRLKFGWVVVRDSTFAKDFSVLMEEPMRYSDVAFIVEGTPIKAHKVFLAASSDYFKGMFTSGLKEAQQDQIDMPHVREDIFRAIREYCYTGDVEEITGDTAVDLLAAASAYSLPRLKMIVESLLGYSLDVDNVACLYSVAQLYSATVLERACEYFMVQNLPQVQGSEAWADLTADQKQTIKELSVKWGLKRGN